MFTVGYAWGVITGLVGGFAFFVIAGVFEFLKYKKSLEDDNEEECECDSSNCDHCNSCTHEKEEEN